MGLTNDGAEREGARVAMTATGDELVSLYICHYTKAANAIAILKERKLRFTTLSRCNDPRETHYWNFSLKFGRKTTDAPGKHEVPPLDDISKQASTLLRDQWQVLCMTMSDPTGDHTSLRGASIAPMWAHYGDTHRGVCLIFRTDILHEDIKVQVAETSASAAMCGPVHYQTRNTGSNEPDPEFTLRADRISAVGLVEAVTEHANEFWKELFLTKSVDWAYEREFRWLVNASIPIAVPIDMSIREVLVGVDCRDQEREEIIELGRAIDCGVGHVGWVNGHATVNTGWFHLATSGNRIWMGL